MISKAVTASARFPNAHGAPVQVGDPAAIGIKDVTRPDWGDFVGIQAGEVPVFWACGVTPQAVALASQARVHDHAQPRPHVHHRPAEPPARGDLGQARPGDLSRAAPPALRRPRRVGGAGRRDQPRGQCAGPGARVPDPAEGASPASPRPSRPTARCSSTTSPPSSAPTSSPPRSARWPPRRGPRCCRPRARVELPCCYGGELGLRAGGRRRQAGPGARGDGAAPRRRRLPRLLRGLHARPALHDGHARAASISRASSTRAPRRRRAAWPSAACSAASTRWRARAGSGCWVARPARLYDPTAADPILLRAGDQVRFRPIERAEYDAIAAEVAAGRFRPRVTEAAMTLLVLDAGPLTTVQDLGRMPATSVSGIPPSGPMDREAFVLANRLVGNPDGAAGLECTLMGPRLEFADARWVAVTGADVAGDPRRRGDAALGVVSRAARAASSRSAPPARACAPISPISGGLATPPGARLARDLSARRARWNRRARDPQERHPAARRGVRRGRSSGGCAPSAFPPMADEPEIDTILGPQDDRFTPAGIAALFDGPYEMLPQSDRMGARFKGAAHRAHARPRHHLRRHRAGGDPGDRGRAAHRAPGGSANRRRLHEDRRGVLVRDRPRRADQARPAAALQQRGGGGRACRRSRRGAPRSRSAIA